jgi:hypothetical protein
VKHRLTNEGARKRAEKERAAGLEPDDDAARWLDEHDPKPAPKPKKFKSKELHRWRQRQERAD